MKEEMKPREWWICQTEGFDGDAYDTDPALWSLSESSYSTQRRKHHVIEKSAYDKLRADEARRVAGLEAALARCKEQRNDWQVAFGQIFEALGKKVPIEFDLKHILEQDAEIDALRTFTEIGG